MATTLRNYKRLTGMTMQELADVFGCTRPTMHRYVSNGFMIRGKKEQGNRVIFREQIVAREQEGAE